MLAPWKKSYGQHRQHIKKQRHYFANKCPSSQGYGFPSSHIWMWELDYKENWAPKNWCFWTVVLKKTLENPSNAQRSNLSILKEISPGYSFEGLMLKLKKESEKAGLKLSVQKKKDQGIQTITSRPIDGEKQNIERLHFLGLQSHCKWWLHPWN